MRRRSAEEEEVERKVNVMKQGLGAGLRRGIVAENVKGGILNLMRTQTAELELANAVNRLKSEKDKGMHQWFKNTVMKQAYLRDPDLLIELNRARILQQQKDIRKTIDFDYRNTQSLWGGIQEEKQEEKQEVVRDRARKRKYEKMKGAMEGKGR